LTGCFQGFDLNGDGVITRDEFRQMIKAYFRLAMEMVRDVVKVMEEGF
jgi:Ca2+-binding EF-hand superfamily protein